VAEWPNAAVLKTAEVARLPRVRIPAPPHVGVQLVAVAASGRRCRAEGSILNLTITEPRKEERHGQGHRLLVVAIACAIFACAPAQDGGADLVRNFFGHLERHQFDAAADLVRETNGALLSAATRNRFVRGWRQAYESYDIRFTNVVVRRLPDSAAGGVPTDDIRRAGAVEGYVYAVKFEGISTSPCVPVNSEVIPGTTQPVALKRADGTWFLLAGGVEGFAHTCPGP
jgi:hypothetical protein